MKLSHQTLSYSHSLSLLALFIMLSSLLHAECDPAPNIDVDWEYHVNNINEDLDDIAYDIEAIDDNNDGDIDGFVVVGSTATVDDL